MNHRGSPSGASASDGCLAFCQDRGDGGAYPPPAAAPSSSMMGLAACWRVAFLERSQAHYITDVRPACQRHRIYSNIFKFIRCITTTLRREEGREEEAYMTSSSTPASQRDRPQTASGTSIQ